ncbi:EF-P 5-aminopentanol modification-associated protein YfmF [Lactovum miscens]|uniref:Putative Zn-dependent peptidase n=1 Tax=Lactovum miscens TaxID=190387 RepID=A0A841C4X4_9LACT|nr:pitrilysin family protein [Lactovum miscens]MBB5887394.1 putative Zn-dependent peptidase [Lactovum miscens]
MPTILTSANGLKIQLIHETKFKTVRIVVRFRELINQEHLAERALLSNLFEVSSSKYATSSDFETALAMNYGTRMSSSVSNKGVQHFLTLAMNVVEPRFVGEDTLKTAVDFLQTVIFEPKVSGNQFDTSIFEIEKNNLLHYFESLLDDNSYLAAKGLSELYFDKKEFSLSNMGSAEQLKQIDAKHLFEYYKEMMTSNVMDIFVLGNITEAEVAELFSSWQFKGKSELTEIFYQQPVKLFESHSIEKEAFQSQLSLAWNLPIQFGDKDYMALQLFNALYGSQPNSKLFSIVRERESLAYEISSYFDSFIGQFRVSAGIDPADYVRVKELTLQLFEAMKNGDFSDEDMAQCKALLRNAFLASQDSVANLVEEAFIDQILPERKLTSKEWLSQLEEVTKGEVQDVAERLTLQAEFQVKGVVPNDY